METAKKKWIFRPEPAAEIVQKLGEELNIRPDLARLLAQRGITDFEKARQFFRPDLSRLHDPFLMKDMDKAVARISEAFERKESIMIYGDYDVDGTTSVALVYGFLRTKYDKLSFYTPDRHTEGYGISRLGIEKAAAAHVKLIISLDCGIKAVEQVNFAAECGIDFIVCDHHLPGEILPPAVAVLDAKQKDCPYPYKELSGCGVGFKLMQALSLRLDYKPSELLDFVELTALSIAADIVPMTGENRILTFFGLKKMNEKPSVGIAALAQVGGLKFPMTVSQTVFGLAPRINAVGRLTHAKGAIELLLSRDEEKAAKLAGLANEINTERRETDAAITEEALEIIRREQADNYSSVVHGKKWHKGVIGIAASRCIEKYYRPTILFSGEDEIISASARSVRGFDIYEAVASCSDLLERYGGHKYAAGMSMPAANFPAFQARFEAYVRRHITEAQRLPHINCEAEVEFKSLGRKMYDILRQMAPFGPENMSPVFCLSPASLPGCSFAQRQTPEMQIL